MRIIPRYVVLELAKVFLATLISLTTMLLLVVVVKEAVDRGVGLVQVLEMLPYCLPTALMYALPGSTLFAVSIVYGRMSGSNEVVALKSLGIGPMAILTPAFALAFLLSLTSVWLNDVAVSWGFGNVQRVVIEAIDEIAVNMLRTTKSFRAGKFSINVKDVEDETLIRPTIMLDARGDTPPVTISADEAELASDTERDLLVFRFRGAHVQSGNVVFSDMGNETTEYAIPLLDASGQADLTKLPAHLPLREIPGDIKARREIAERIESLLALDAAFPLLVGDFDALANQNIEARREDLKFQRDQISKLKIESPRRWASGFSCLCFVLIGAPMAIRLRNSDFLTSFFACFLPILVVYYPLFIYGLDRAKEGSLPGASVWLGNIMLCLWGAWLLRRVIRF